jgi:hydrogenase nickel incorporation protein HypA/HybF
MHEASLALHLVHLACQAATEAGEHRVTAVRVRYGVLSGVSPSAFQAAFSMAAAGTPLAQARLELEEGPLIAHCAVCQCAVTLRGLLNWSCPVCGQATHDLIAGRDVELIALEVE